MRCFFRCIGFMGSSIVEYLEGNSPSNFRVWHRSPHIQCMSYSLLKVTMQRWAVFKSCEKVAIRTCSRSNFENNVSAFEPRLLHNGLYQKWVLQNMLSLAFLELNPLKPLLRWSPFALRLPARHGCVVPPCVYSLEAKIKKLKKSKRNSWWFQKANYTGCLYATYKVNLHQKWMSQTDAHQVQNAVSNHHN